MKSYLSILKAFSLSIILTAVAPNAEAASFCSNTLINYKGISRRTKTIRTWSAYERTTTLSGWDQEKRSNPLMVSYVPADSVDIEILSEGDVHQIDSVLLPTDGMIPWFKHPYNTDSTVPNFNAPNVKFGTATHTTSRTIYTEINNRLVSIKMPTNRPFGPNRLMQPKKVKMDADLKYSVQRSKAIEQLDTQIGTDKDLAVQKEIAAVIDKRTGNGFLFRDMEVYRNGYTYLSAHLIPTIGAEIAEKNGANQFDFWKTHWAEPIGRLQAKLLYRYGMTVREVNPQNFVIELDKNLKPTGRIIWRDLAESHLITPIASKLGLQEFIDKDIARGGWGARDVPSIKSVYITWHFEDSNPQYDADVITGWKSAHDNAFFEELRSALKIEIPNNAQVQDYLNSEFSAGQNSTLIQAVVRWNQANKTR